MFIWASRGHARPAGARGAVRGERRGRQRAGVGGKAGTRGGRGAGRVLRRVQKAHAVTHLRAAVRPAAVPAAAAALHRVSALDAGLALSVVARPMVAAVATAVPAAAAVAAAAAVPAVVLLRHLNAQHGRRSRPAGLAAACGAEAGVGGQPLHRGTLVVHTLLVLKHGGLEVPLLHEQLLQHLLLLRHQRVQRSDLLASAAAAAAAALALASERQLLRSERSPVGA
mmetsp:Transcript_21902/g.52326  ORF Transcript_21902/g.52326 Transcript_21902/m.52326 type:complete len:226 (-) Transcript_21902:884-1561(-)